MSGPLVHNPVVKELGISQFGMYRCSHAPGYTYDQVAKLWVEEQDGDYNPEINSNDDDDDGNEDADANNDELNNTDGSQLIDPDQELKNLQQHQAPTLEPGPSNDSEMQSTSWK